MTACPVSLTTAPVLRSATKTNHQAIAANTVMLSQPRTAPVARALNSKRCPPLIRPARFVSTAPGFSARRCRSNMPLPASFCVLEEIDAQQTPAEARWIERSRRDKRHVSLLIPEDEMQSASAASTRNRSVDDERRSVKALPQDHAGPLD